MCSTASLDELGSRVLLSITAYCSVLKLSPATTLAGRGSRGEGATNSARDPVGFGSSRPVTARAHPSRALPQRGVEAVKAPPLLNRSMLESVVISQLAYR